VVFFSCRMRRHKAIVPVSGDRLRGADRESRTKPHPSRCQHHEGFSDRIAQVNLEIGGKGEICLPRPRFFQSPFPDPEIIGLHRRQRCFRYRFPSHGYLGLSQGRRWCPCRIRDLVNGMAIVPILKSIRYRYLCPLRRNIGR